MATLQVNDKDSGKMVEVLIDHESLQKVKAHSYQIDKHFKKPHRVVKSKNGTRKVFLDRELSGCGISDGKVVYHINGDMLDCRKNNLLVKERNVNHSPNRWPGSVESLLNFLGKRPDKDEDLCAEFLAKTDIKKYTKKRIDIVASAEMFEIFGKKNIHQALKRVLAKYFNWAGTLNIAKDLSQKPVADKDKSKEQEIWSEYPLMASVFHNAPTQLETRKSPEELIRDNKLFPTELLIKALKERGAVSIQF